ncbi:MAG: nucleotidyltransferase family protein [Acidobacteriota bacterium]
MTTPHIDIDREEVAKLCRKFGIRRLSLFGSVNRDDFREDSDVDVLVEFLPHVKVGLSFFSLQSELSHLLGRRVDLSTPGFLSAAIRDEVTSEARPVYEAA